MKLKLLLTALLLFTLQGFSQATAFPAVNINQCNNEVFDLTVNTAVVLGNQNPNDYTVAYFTSQANADANVNPIQDPTFFVPNGEEATVYVRVTNNANGDFDTTSFVVDWGWSFVEDYPDVVTCGDPYVLPGLQMASYYTGPQGTGTMLPPGTVITSSQMIYVFLINGSCSTETSFNVTIGGGLQANQPSPLVVCNPAGTIITVDLTSKIPEIMMGQSGLTVSFYETQFDAEANANQIPNPNSYTSPNFSLPYLLFVRVESDFDGCFAIFPLEIVEGECTDNALTGVVLYDMDANGCTPNDVPAAGIPVQYEADGEILTTFTTPTGQYYFSNLPDGMGTVSVAQATMYTVTPASQQVTFPGNTDEFSFCLTASNPVNDVAVTIVPLSGAQAGFPSYYALYFENNGSLPASGTVTLTFDNANLTYVSSSPSMTGVSGTTLILPYTNLQPFQSGMAIVTFTVNVPQVTPAGTVLNFTASIDPVTGDANPADNTYTLAQTVVNSWDPNDITVHEGETITPDQADEYLHYTIRFQNKGDANAVNVAIENPIDVNLDLATLEPIGASHNYTTTIENGSVRFDFDNINLTWEDNDEMGSQGYVSYRIKPVSTVGLDDYMHGGSAGIFFDFNDPVMTNVVSTTIQNEMGTENFSSKGFVIYPNPASGVVNIRMADISGKADVAITDVLGKTVLAKEVTFINSATKMDIASLESGLYLVTVTSGGKSVTKKLMIK